MSKIFEKYGKLIDQNIEKIEQWQIFFEKKIENQAGTSFDNKNDWDIAYKGKYNDESGTSVNNAGTRTTTSSNGDKEVSIPHSQKRTVDNIYKELARMNDMANILTTLPKIMEGELQDSFKKTNLEIKEGRELYENTDAKYRLGKNMSEATGILKIDSYDRNIEENFYIMYYLLSYGVLGYFIYKLLKM